MTAFATQFGEGFEGRGAEAAHLNTVLGARGGPVEGAWVSALARPGPGHVPFVTEIFAVSEKAARSETISLKRIDGRATMAW